MIKEGKRVGYRRTEKKKKKGVTEELTCPA